MKNLDKISDHKERQIAEASNPDIKAMTDGELRNSLETLLKYPISLSCDDPSQTEALTQIQICQIELELQNRELKSSHRVLEESRERYAELYDNAPVGYVTLNSKGIIHDINLTAVAILERQRSLLIGMPLGLCLEKGCNTDLFYFLHQLAEGQGDITLETFVSRPQGELREVQLVGDARSDQHTGETQYRIAIYDITERKRVEHETQTRKDALVHMARINTVGELAASLAHELTQPLQAVEHYNFAALKLLRQQDKGQDEVLELLQGAQLQLQRAGKIIFHLRKFIRHGVINKCPTNLPDVINAALELMQPMLRDKGVNVRVAGVDRLPMVNVEPIQIEQVLVNLLRNSVDAMNNAKSVTRRIDIELVSDGKFIQVTVRDTGPGFNSGSIERIFDVLTSDKVDGMGMGLAISRSLIKAHGGRLWADTQAENGAVLNFTLPVIDLDMDANE